MYEVILEPVFPEIQEEEVLTGVIGIQIGTTAVDLMFYDGVATTIPMDTFSRCHRRQLTEIEILNHKDKEYAKWYQAKLAEAEKKDVKDETSDTETSTDSQKPTVH